MKKIVSLFLVLLLISCFKDESAGTNAKLPEITTEGKNTFGCKIGTETFLPRRKSCLFCQEILKANYYHLEYYYSGLVPGYYFRIYAVNQITNKSIVITTEALENPLVSGQTYPIVLKGNNKFDANYSYSPQVQDPNNPNIIYHTTHDYNTTDEINGMLEIIFLDETNTIISGIFHFDAKNTVEGTVAEIKNGRFDLIYEPYLY